MQGPGREYRELMLKRPKLPRRFQRKVFEGKVRERVQGM